MFYPTLDVIDWLNQWHEVAQPFYLDAIESEWQYNINITSSNEEAYNAADKRFKAFVKSWSDRSKTELPPYDLDAQELDKCLTAETFPEIPGLHEKQPWTVDRQQRAIMRIQTFKVYHEKDMDASALDENRLDQYQEWKIFYLHSTRALYHAII